MNYYTLGVFLAVISLISGLGSFFVIREGVRATPPFTVVANDHGVYSYTKFNGRLADETFATRLEAESAAQRHHEWSDAYDGRAVVPEDRGFKPVEKK